MLSITMKKLILVIAFVFVCYPYNLINGDEIEKEYCTIMKLLEATSEETKQILLEELLIFTHSLNKINMCDEHIGQHPQKNKICYYDPCASYRFTYFLRVNSWGSEIVNRIKNGSLESLPIDQYPLMHYINPLEYEGQKKANLVFNRWKESIDREWEAQKKGESFDVNSLHSLNALITLYHVLNANCDCKRCACLKSAATAPVQELKTPDHKIDSGKNSIEFQNRKE
ncbi:MAG: hypothetical protein LBE12_05280 [Planctomycetaceae bacterium]|jgi:hypothetical protein|nr:hypothetical protein [Planctomycetaceae bacterium]